MPISTTVEVLPVELADLPRCAQIMHDAFEGDKIMGTLYPPHMKQAYSDTERFRRQGKDMQRTHFESPGKKMFKAVDRETGKIIGVAIWAEPGTPIKLPGEGETEEHRKKKEMEIDENDKDLETDEEAGKRLFSALVTKRREVMKDQPHWYLSFLIIDPEAQGKGVGSALMDWGFQQVDKADPPLPVVLESSAPGRPLYEKRGFVACGDIHVLGAPTFPIMVRPPRATP